MPCRREPSFTYLAHPEQTEKPPEGGFFVARRLSLRLCRAFCAARSSIMWTRASIILLLGLLCGAAAAQSPGLAGTWQTIDDKTGHPKALIRIDARPDGSFDGSVVKGLEPGVDPERVCTLCTDSRKGQKIAGMTVLVGLRPDGDAHFSGGRILDPDNGEVYRCNATLIDGGAKLEVRGYIGIPLLGRTQTWVREP
jgi:uncharacterized protein (DUF2147 family)